MSFIGPRQRALVRVAPLVSLQGLLDAHAVESEREALSLVEPSPRSHALTPEVVFSLVLGLGLWREKSVPEVLNQVLSPWGIRDAVTDGAIAHARRRLGAAPLRRFFELEAAAQPCPASFEGRRVHALDGVYLAVADTPSNARAFGRPHCVKKGRPLPHMLVLTLSDAMTHHLRAASMHPCRTGEREPGLELLEGLSRGDLTLMDRGFYSAGMLLALQARKLEYVVRVPASVKPEVIRRRGDGDADVAIRTHYRRERPRRAGRRRWDHHSEELEVRTRLIEYRVSGSCTRFRLVTNVADVDAKELAELYHARWEAELGYDEIENHLAAGRHGAQDLPVRGRSPELVEQEVWALLALYNLIRRAMTATADRRRLDPRGLSFTQVVETVRATAASAPARSRPGSARVRCRLLHEIERCRMRRWRRRRRCPRAVRARWNQFPGKTRNQREVAATYRVTLLTAA